jgi:hypothetical protein
MRTELPQTAYVTSNGIVSAVVALVVLALLALAVWP